MTSFIRVGTVYSVNCGFLLLRKTVQARDKGVDGAVEGGDLELKARLFAVVPFHQG
jgi:hypothetical protein